MECRGESTDLEAELCQFGLRIEDESKCVVHIAVKVRANVVAVGAFNLGKVQHPKHLNDYYYHYCRITSLRSQNCVTSMSRSPGARGSETMGLFPDTDTCICTRTQTRTCTYMRRFVHRRVFGSYFLCFSQVYRQNRVLVRCVSSSS